MKISHLANTRFTSILLFLFITLQISACSTGESSKSSTAYLVEPYPPGITDVNHAAVITGVDSGSVTEDIDVDGDNLLKVGGTLTITEIDAAEDAFVAISIEGAYGSLTISADGIWIYSADNDQAVIQNLDSGASLSEHITINSIDGTEHTLVININGTDDTSAPIVTDPIEPDSPTTITDPVEPDSPTTITDPVEPDNTILISLAWTAPSEREDNTPILLSAIAGYNVYYGSELGQYPNTVNIADGTAVSYIFTDLPTGTYYFVVTTYDTDGRESQYSSVVIKTI